jgi:hypothetical protein
MTDREELERDPLVDEEEHAAAAEAAQIGGDPGDHRHSEAERPLAEAGQGYAEGFEEAEEDLIERAQHGEQPHVSTISEEAESDRSTAVYGEPDSVGRAEMSQREQDERVDDPAAEPPGHHPDPDPDELGGEEGGGTTSEPDEPPGHHPDPDPSRL